jgi:hypothetical protein
MVEAAVMEATARATKTTVMEAARAWTSHYQSRYGRNGKSKYYFLVHVVPFFLLVVPTRG